MAATPQDIKDFLALSGNNPAVTDDQLIRVRAWLSSAISKDNPDSDDLVDYTYKTWKEQTLAYERRNTVVTF